MPYQKHRLVFLASVGYAIQSSEHAKSSNRHKSTVMRGTAHCDKIDRKRVRKEEFEVTIWIDNFFEGGVWCCRHRAHARNVDVCLESINVMLFGYLGLPTFLVVYI